MSDSADLFSALDCPSPVSWNDIRGLFTAHDIACMKPRGIDLTDYQAVRDRATDIYNAVKSGYMPLGGPRWTPAQVQTFGCWAKQGFPE